MILGYLVLGYLTWTKCDCTPISRPSNFEIYEALVAGHLDGEGTVDIPVVYDPSRPPLHIVDASHNKPALTHWQAIEHFQIQGQPVTRVKLTPDYRRSHQLRVHMQYLGHSIVGDTLYATTGTITCSSSVLACQTLSFNHLSQGNH